MDSRWVRAALFLAAAVAAHLTLTACESSGGVTVTGTGQTNLPVVDA